jgi:hypothetical protein
MRSTPLKILGLSIAAMVALAANPALARHHHHHVKPVRHHHHHGKKKADGRVCPPNDPTCHGGGGRKFP